MKILLVGEYSRLHNSLKEGLQKLGHEVVLVGFGDGFKNFPVDIKLQRKWDHGLLCKIRIGIHKISGFDISSYLTYRQFVKHRSESAGCDIVQLINENSFFCDFHFERKILQFLFDNNKKVFLLSCGSDYKNTNYHFENPQVKSILQPYFAGKVSDKEFTSVLKFRKPSFKKLHQYIHKNISGIIATDMDYDAPLANDPKYMGVIPNPVNISRIPYSELQIPGRIKIFHGINTENYYKKGSDYFEKALEVVQQRHPDKVAISITRSLPYDEYIKMYDDCHILLDQVYAIDQGYNALEAMAKGKVVFTGAEKEFTERYAITEPVAINAVPDVESIVTELSRLIENPQEILNISRRARKFIEEEHDYVEVAQKYTEIWNTR